MENPSHLPFTTEELFMLKPYEIKKGIPIIENAVAMVVDIIDEPTAPASVSLPTTSISNAPLIWSNCKWYFIVGGGILIACGISWHYYKKAQRRKLA